MPGQKLPQKKNNKNKKQKSKAKRSWRQLPQVKTPFTLGDYIPKDFFDSDSSDDHPTKQKMAQCCMVSWADEWEEVNGKLINTIYEVGQVTIQSGFYDSNHQNQWEKRRKKK